VLWSSVTASVRVRIAGRVVTVALVGPRALLVALLLLVLVLLVLLVLVFGVFVLLWLVVVLLREPTTRGELRRRRERRARAHLGRYSRRSVWWIRTSVLHLAALLVVLRRWLLMVRRCRLAGLVVGRGVARGSGSCEGGCEGQPSPTAASSSTARSEHSHGVCGLIQVVSPVTLLPQNGALYCVENCSTHGELFMVEMRREASEREENKERFGRVARENGLSSQAAGPRSSYSSGRHLYIELEATCASRRSPSTRVFLLRKPISHRRASETRISAILQARP